MSPYKIRRTEAYCRKVIGNVTVSIYCLRELMFLCSPRRNQVQSWKQISLQNSIPGLAVVSKVWKLNCIRELSPAFFFCKQHHIAICATNFSISLFLFKRFSPNPLKIPTNTASRTLSYDFFSYLLYFCEHFHLENIS